MRLSYLAVMHNSFLVGAVLFCAFLGMVLAYNTRHAYETGQEAGAASVLVRMNMRQLSEFDI